MDSILRGKKNHVCHACEEVIPKNTLKMKTVLNNHKYSYYHIHCIPRQIVNKNLKNWLKASEFDGRDI